jgi:hypothetical protein
MAPSSKDRPDRPSDARPRSKWTKIDLAAAEKLTEITSAPGHVFHLRVEDLPKNLRMPGAVSYFASGYSAPVTAGSAVTVGGEFGVLRTEGDLRKAYNFVFATSSDGALYFNGPYKDFDDHHIEESQPVVIFTILNNTPFSPKSGR